MNKYFKIILIVFVVLLSSFVASYFTSITVKKDNLKSLANSELYELGYVLDALDYLNSSSIQDPSLRNKLEIPMVSALLIVRTINPKMNDLYRTPLVSLCRAIIYERKHGIAIKGLGKYKDTEIPKGVIKYLNNIKPELRKQMELRKFKPITECKLI